MRQLLLLAAFCAAVFSNAQTTVYDADFSNAGDGFADHSSSAPPVPGPVSVGPFGVSPNSWELSYTITPNTDGSANSFKVVAGELQSDDWGGQGIFTSQNIDVSAISSVNISAIGVNSGANDDDFTYFYILDGGSRVETSVGASNNGDAVNYSVLGLDVSSASTLVVGFEFSENGGGDGYDISEFTVNIASSNPAPVITNITATPTMPSSTDAVLISADITDLDGFASTTLNWGTVSGSLNTPLSMTNTTGAIFEATIPAQADGTQVFFNIVAVDANNTAAETTTTLEQSYTVMDPQPQGFAIPLADTRYVIDFNNPVPNVNNASFDGSGLAQLPVNGQLDSNSFAFEGFSDGDADFNMDNTTGDFARGTSTGGVSSAGIYAFDFGGGNTGLGIQPTGGEFTPGTIFFKLRNETGATITTLDVAYDAFFFNNEMRTNDLQLGHGVDEMNISYLPATDVDSGIGEDASPEWQRNLVTAQITGLSIANGDTYLIAWNTNDGGGGSSDELALDNIQIIANPSTESPRLLGNVNSITTADGNVILNSRVEVAEFVNLSGGTITTNDNLVFTSTDGTNAVLNRVRNGGMISGNVEVEQFYPAQRAFRFVSVPVDMTNTVFQDWQNGGVTTPGIGTHITGGTMSDGFDQSTTNNPSAFGWDNSNSQSWIDISSANGFATNNTSLNAGTPTRILIRGDRSVSLTTAGAPATDTKLVTTGTVQIGPDTQTFGTNLLDGEFVFVGNPYPSKVDAASVLTAPTTQDINPQFMYVWNPQAGTRGAYRTYDFTASTSTPVDAAVDGEIQPSQAVFFAVLDDGNAPYAPEITFDETDKVGGSMTTAIYSTPVVDGSFNLNLYNVANIAMALDGVTIKFSATGNDAVDGNDLKKLNNLDENIAISAGNESLIIGSFSMPQDGTVIPLQVYGFTSGDYRFAMNYSNISSLNAYLKDNFTGINHPITNGGLTEVSLNFDNSNNLSMATGRFEIVFSNTTLGLNDSAFAKALSLYPNPVKDGIVTVTGIENETVQKVRLTNMLGQVIMEPNYRFIENGKLSVELNEAINAGVYLLLIDNQSLRVVIE